ncbi:MAG: glycosyltransferase [Thermodesulfovibrionales bacterium]|jgi:ceramide glucosyltransferase
MLLCDFLFPFNPLQKGLPLPDFFYPSRDTEKPLKGLADNLFHNLENFSNQDYPEYEIIFSLRDNNNPTYKIARKTKNQNPQRNISFLVERCNEGLIEKVNNLIPACKIVKHQLMLGSDSNAMVAGNYLKENTRPMKGSGAVL